MKLLLETADLRIDPWLMNYVSATVGFATWHHELDEAHVLVRLRGNAGPGGPARVHCEIRVKTPRRGETVASAMGSEVCEATQQAADRLEVELFQTRDATASFPSGAATDVARRGDAPDARARARGTSPAPGPLAA